MGLQASPRLQVSVGKEIGRELNERTNEIKIYEPAPFFSKSRFDPERAFLPSGRAPFSLFGERAMTSAPEPRAPNVSALLREVLWIKLCPTARSRCARRAGPGNGPVPSEPIFHK